MRLLLDTHFFIWLAVSPEVLSSAELDALRGATERYVSTISIWELRIKWNQLDRQGRRKGALDPAEAFAFLELGDPKLDELTATDFARPLSPPTPHRDPFDEMLLVHADRLGARLLTRDTKLLGHPIAYQA